MLDDVRVEHQDGSDEVGVDNGPDDKLVVCEVSWLVAGDVGGTGANVVVSTAVEVALVVSGEVGTTPTRNNES